MKLTYLLFVIFMTMGLNACIKPPDFSDIPSIEFISLTKNSMLQSSFQLDSLWINFSFTDGDGDLGDLDSFNVFLKDNRDGFIASKYTIPVIPEEASGNGIKGDISLLLYTTCCYYSNGFPPCEPNLAEPTDTLTYDIYIKDRAGNLSNIITTDPIYLQCQ